MFPKHVGMATSIYIFYIIGFNQLFVVLFRLSTIVKNRRNL